MVYKGTIVSVDPGITTGMAVLDIYGNLLLVASRRDIKRNDIIKFISKFGRPLIVATDRNPPPKSVEKIASIMGSKIYVPEESLSVSEKLELTKDFTKRVRNDHELDALSASIKAWKNYRDLFSKINYTLQELGLSEIFEEVVLKLLKEESGNIDDAINKVLTQRRKVLPELKIPEKMTIQDYKSLVEQLQKRLVQKENDIRILLQQSDNLNRALMRAREDLEKLKDIKLSLALLDRLREENEELKNSVKLLKSFEKISDMGFYPIIEIERIDGSYLEELDDRIGLKNRVVFCNSSENLNLLNDFRIKCLVTEKLPEERAIKNLEYPIILLKEDWIQTFDVVKAIKKTELDGELKNVRKSGLIEWLKGYREREE